MNINEFIYMTESASDEFDIDMLKNNYYAESSEMLKKVKMSEAKVERLINGDTDSVYTESVITDKHVDNMEKMIEKSLADFTKYIDKVEDSFNSQFKTTDVITELDIPKKLKANRMLAKTKLSTINANDEIKIINKYIDLNMKYMHKLASGIASKEDVDKVDKLMDDYDNEITAVRKNKATIEESYNKTYRDLESNIKKLPSILKMAEKENSDFSHNVLVPIIKAKKSGKDTEILSVSTKALSNDSFLHKDLVNCYVKHITSQYSAIKNAGNIKTESFQDDMALIDELVNFYTESKTHDEKVDNKIYTESSSRAPAITKSPKDIKKYITNDGLNNVAKTDEGKGLGVELLKYASSSASPVIVSKSGISSETKAAIMEHVQKYKDEHNIEKIKDERSVLNYVLDILNTFAKDVYSETVTAYTDTVNECIKKSDTSALDVMITDLEKGPDGIVKSKVAMDKSVSSALLNIVKKGKKAIPTVKSESTKEFDIDAYFDNFNHLLDD